MKIILNFEDIKQLILDSYNGVNEVIIKDDNIEFNLDVDGDNFFRLKDRKPKDIIISTDNVSEKTNKEIKETKQIKRPERKHTLGEPLDFDSLVAEKPVIETEPIPSKEKTLEEKNQEAMAKGLMTSGRGSERVTRKF